MSTDTTSLTPEERAKRWGFYAKVAGFAVLCVVVAPYVGLAIQGMLGIGVMVAVGGIYWATSGWLADAASNLRLKLIKMEAAKNPIETLQNNLRLQMVALDQRKTNIEKLNATIRLLADKVDAIRMKYGVQDNAYVTLNADVIELRQAYATRCQKWKEAKAQLNRFAEEIERVSMIWEAGNSLKAARESSGLTADDFMNKLKTDTAFTAVQTNYNEAMASLDSVMMDTPKVQATDPAFKELLQAPANISANAKHTSN